MIEILIWRRSCKGLWWQQTEHACVQQKMERWMAPGMGEQPWRRSRERGPRWAVSEKPPSGGGESGLADPAWWVTPKPRRRGSWGGVSADNTCRTRGGDTGGPGVTRRWLRTANGASVFGKDSGSSGCRLRTGRLVGKTITKLPWESRSLILHPAFPRRKQLPALAWHMDPK